MSDSWDPTDCSLPGSSVHGILQAKILEWVAISFSRGSSWPRNWSQVSFIAGRFMKSCKVPIMILFFFCWENWGLEVISKLPKTYRWWLSPHQLVFSNVPKYFQVNSCALSLSPNRPVGNTDLVIRIFCAIQLCEAEDGRGGSPSLLSSFLQACSLIFWL